MQPPLLSPPLCSTPLPGTWPNLAHCCCSAAAVVVVVVVVIFIVFSLMRFLVLLAFLQPFCVVAVAVAADAAASGNCDASCGEAVKLKWNNWVVSEFFTHTPFSPSLLSLCLVVVVVVYSLFVAASCKFSSSALGFTFFRLFNYLYAPALEVEQGNKDSEGENRVREGGGEGGGQLPAGALAKNNFLIFQFSHFYN